MPVFLMTFALFYLRLNIFYHLVLFLSIYSKQFINNVKSFQYNDKLTVLNYIICFRRLFF